MSAKKEFVRELDGYDSEARMLGDCGVCALWSINDGAVFSMSTCTLEVRHDGLHEWDPDYVDPDDDEEEW